MVKILYEYGADLDARTEKDWTPLSYAKAMKYGLVDEKEFIRRRFEVLRSDGVWVGAEIFRRALAEGVL